MSIEKNFDVPFIASLALREKQIQQNYRPIIAVHKWFARRPGALFRGLALSEFSQKPLAQAYFEANDFHGRKVADPFMGGGTPLIETNRMGCDVEGFDINPMAAWIVREEIEHLDLSLYGKIANEFIVKLRKEIGVYYRTSCPLYGDSDVPVKYFLWVKVLDCEACGKEFDLFPGYLVAENKRHPLNVLVCSKCGELNEVNDRKKPDDCFVCGTSLSNNGPARRNRCNCPKCGHLNSYPGKCSIPFRHRMFAIEYYNPKRKSKHKGRFFKKPDAEDLAKADAAAKRWNELAAKFVPNQEIPSGDETNRLHRWGYNFYRDMFNPRQLLCLELSCRLIAKVRNERVRHALATNLSDLLRYQNMLCRYDTMALKALDIFSVHGFPVGLVQCESNFLGIKNERGINVGSGGWRNIIEKYTKAKEYCDAPFEIKRNGSKKIRIPIRGEWIGERLNGRQSRDVKTRCASATTISLAPKSLDAVFTDPPYFGNVQYGELMDFCYVWLRGLVGNEPEGFDRASTRSPNELTGNVTLERGLVHFTEGLSATYRIMAKALKPGAPLAFTYHHNKLEAYHAVGVAILDARLTCSASFPCPAEMGGSIHIHGTSSSIVDSVFVCRLTGSTSRDLLFKTPQELTTIIAKDLEQLRAAGMKPSYGDIRCITYGHLTRMAIWNLRENWSETRQTHERIDQFARALACLVRSAKADELITNMTSQTESETSILAEEYVYEGMANAVSF